MAVGACAAHRNSFSGISARRKHQHQSVHKEGDKASKQLVALVITRLKFSLYSRFSEQARAAFYPCSTRKVRVLITLQEALALAYQDTDF